MSRKPSSKWGRVVTACSECHRRKQKCDRKHPCNICIARNVPDRCLYENQTPAAAATKQEEVRALLPHPDPLMSTSTFEDEEAISQNTQESSLAGQIGYSYQKESNAYQSLQKSFRIPDELIKLHDPVAINSKKPSQDPSLTSRYRNLVALLPPAAICKALIEVYFAEVSWYSAQLDRYYFEADCASWLKAYNASSVKNLSRDLQFFPALLFQVLAVAVQFLPPATLTARLLQVENPASRERLSHRYSTAGTEIMAVLKRHNPTLASIQHDQIRSLWLKCCSRGTESWYCLTDAIRQAQDLGLHIQDEVAQGQDVGETLSRLWFDEHKRRIWVALFIADSHMSIILGRPRLINASDCTVRTPFDCDIPSDPSTTIPGTVKPGSPPSHYSLSLFNYAVGHLFHEMLSFGVCKKHTKNYDRVGVLHSKINTLLHDLPPAVRPLNPDTSWDTRDPGIPRQRQQIATVANSFLMSLHREHVQVHASSREAAVRAGIEVLNAQEKMSSLLQSYHYRMYGLSCHTIDACMFLSATALDEHTVATLDPNILQEMASALRRAIDQLTLMGPMSPMARSGAELLEQCYPQVKKTIERLCGNAVTSPVTTNSSTTTSSGGNDSERTLEVEYRDNTMEGGQLATGQPLHNYVNEDWSRKGNRNEHMNGNENQLPLPPPLPATTSLSDFGGDRFRPDMFEDIVTLDMGQDGWYSDTGFNGNTFDFDFEMMEADMGGLDFDSIAADQFLAETTTTTAPTTITGDFGTGF